MAKREKFEIWANVFGIDALRRSLNVSRQSVENWRRFSSGQPRGTNSHPPSLEMAYRIHQLSGGAVTLADFLPSSATESVRHGRHEDRR